ncbi:MAG: hypothetical protein RL136_698 [Planctomycetota bacterium]
MQTPVPTPQPTRSAFRLALIPMLCMIAAHTARADIVSIVASRDATLYESEDGTLANGAGEYFFAGNTYQGRARRGLVHFDIASLVPTGATIVSARLHVYSWQGILGTHAISLHRALEDWTCGTSNPDGPEGVGTDVTAGDTTWLFCTADGAGGGTAWSTPGGVFASEASASVLIGETGFYSWSSAQLAEDVRSFLADPASNFGWFLVGNESEFGTARRFDSVESAAFGGFPPTLEIEYATVPSPGAIALVALAGGTRRRRR